MVKAESNSKSIYRKMPFIPRPLRVVDLQITGDGFAGGVVRSGRQSRLSRLVSATQGFSG
jgi:hypothetical protein